MTAAANDGGRCDQSLTRESKNDALAANIDQGVPMPAADATEEGADLVNFDCHGSKQTAGLALPHVASPTPIESGERTFASPATQVREPCRLLQDQTYGGPTSENAFQKWHICEIARQVEYVSRVTIDIREARRPARIRSPGARPGFVTPPRTCHAQRKTAYAL